jgi:hypothetical protein
LKHAQENPLDMYQKLGVEFAIIYNDYQSAIECFTGNRLLEEGDIVIFNDDKEITHKDVLAYFDQAIAKSEELDARGE